MTTEAPGGVKVGPMAPAYNIATAIQLWHGPPKVGKSSTVAALGTVAAEYDLPVKPFFLHMEAGTGGFECTGTCEECPDCKGTGKKGRSKCPTCEGSKIVRLVLTTTDQIREWCEWFAQSEYNILVIDTVDMLYQVIMDNVCVGLQIPNPAASDHGLAYTLALDDLRDVLSIPIGAGKGLILIMHTYEREQRVRGGGVTTKSTFNVPGKARPYLAGLADQVFHLAVLPHPTEDGDQHILIAAATAGVEAGDRWGLFPEEGLDLGDSAEAAATAILTQYGYLED